MKNLISLIIITFSLLIVSNVESIGQTDTCRPGFDTDTVIVTIGSCDFEVEVCMKCQYTNPGEVYINLITELDSSCYTGLTAEQITAQIYTEISTGAFIWANFCLDTKYTAPPCLGDKTNWAEFKIVYSYCWQVWYRYNGNDDVYQYKPCDDNATCTETLKYCFNYSTMEYNKGPSSYTGPQTPPCSLQFHQITIPQVLGTASSCYILNSVPCGTN